MWKAFKTQPRKDQAAAQGPPRPQQDQYRTCTAHAKLEAQPTRALKGTNHRARAFHMHVNLRPNLMIRPMLHWLGPYRMNVLARAGRSGYRIYWFTTVHVAF